MGFAPRSPSLRAEPLTGRVLMNDRNMDNDDLLFGRTGAMATVTLNRPQALNAFTLDMYRRLGPVLRGWANDPAVRLIVIRPAEGRAFCSGGDIRAIYEAGRGIAGDPSLPADFFREEYRIIRAVHRYPKPCIAVIDGITMGGGAGVAVNGAYRIATERTLFAMPETGIGLFPDVGATRFLNLCPGQIGRYLGLTGARLGPADALYCGFATHFVPRARIAALIERLPGAGSRDRIEAALGAVGGDAGAPPLAARRAAIDRCFAGERVEDIVAALDREAASGGADAEWAAATRAALAGKSPTSLKIALRQLTIGRGCDIEAALILEYRLSQHVMHGHDFYEGVRAAVIDKDHKPRWQPASLAEVTDGLVDSYFAPLGDGELQFD